MFVINNSYKLLNNITYILKKSWYIDKILIIITAIQIPIIVSIPLLNTYLSKYVVELVSNKVNMTTLLFSILVLSTVILILNLGNQYMTAKIHWRSFGNRFKYMDIYNQKIMSMDYALLENPDGQNKSQKALNVILGDDGGTQQIFSQIVSIFSNAIGLIAYSFILLTFNPWIVLLLFAITVISYLLGKRNNIWNYKNKDNWVIVDRKLQYIKNKSGDFEMAKDIRIFNMANWFKSLFEKFLTERIYWYKKSEKHGFIIDFATTIMNFIRDGVAYGVLIYEAVYGHLAAADFVLYFALITQYSGWFLGVVSAYLSLQNTSLDICNLREFLDMEDHFNHGKGIAVPKEAPEIEFRDISFQYPGSDTFILKNLNLFIKKGEKIALVGLNGAGKTTFVKLLCGLYKPTNGEILVNGKKLFEYNIEEYYGIISAVFQDVLLMPVSIAKNIALCEEKAIDCDMLESVLKSSGLYEKVQSLPKKENTTLLKGIHAESVDLSGGEKQKLALARALYKKGLILILDEPTAALDPIAENEMYQKYNRLTQNTTSVFISHRLSSTRFCDRILYLENGEIIEMGTHQSLMEKKGKYAELFEIQSHYYKEGVSS